MIFTPLATIALLTINVKLIETSFQTLASSEFIIVTLTLSQHPGIRDGLENFKMRFVQTLRSCRGTVCHFWNVFYLWPSWILTKIIFCGFMDRQTEKSYFDVYNRPLITKIWIFSAWTQLGSILGHCCVIQWMSIHMLNNIMTQSGTSQKSRSLYSSVEL